MKVAILDHSLHFKTTGSTRFLIDLLKVWFGDVTTIDLASLWEELPKAKWDLVIVFQHQYPPAVLEAFGCDNVVLVPMQDDCPKTRDYWIRYRGFKILSFSSTLAALLEGWGLEVFRVSYRPPVPSCVADFSDGLRGFFWPRTSELDWRQVGPLAEQTRWASFHLHTAHVQSQTVLPGPEALPGAEIIRTNWFDKPQDFADALSRANVFFAPRRHEGIGMAVLEALALGQCVVAPDFPTANEYIVDGIDGVLFDPEHPGQIPWSRVEALGQAARRSAEKGRAEWEVRLPALRGFLETKPLRPRRGFHPWIVLRGRGKVWLNGLLRATKKGQLP